MVGWHWLAGKKQGLADCSVASGQGMRGMVGTWQVRLRVASPAMTKWPVSNSTPYTRYRPTGQDKAGQGRASFFQAQEFSSPD